MPKHKRTRGWREALTSPDVAGTPQAPKQSRRLPAPSPEKTVTIPSRHSRHHENPPALARHRRQRGQRRQSHTSTPRSHPGSLRTSQPSLLSGISPHQISLSFRSLIRSQTEPHNPIHHTLRSGRQLTRNCRRALRDPASPRRVATIVTKLHQVQFPLTTAAQCTDPIPQDNSTPSNPF